MAETFQEKLGEFFDRLANLPFVPRARTCLLVALGTLMVLSLLMVASASIPFATKQGMNELKFFWSQFGYMLIAIAAGSVVYQFPLSELYRHRTILVVFVLMLGLLASTLLFAQEINGAKRWLSIFGFSFQPAELVKMFMVIIVAEYIQRRSAELRHYNMLIGILRLAIWYVPILLLLFFQPDFGSIVVLAGTLLAIFFVAGVRLYQFLALSVVLVAIGTLALVSADYRQSRLMQFMDPFDDVLGDDYQLSRSLVAFGRGEFNGVGYGNSVQKLDHLPEAHTDFLLAITGEELGFIGVALVIILEFIIIFATMRISYNALVRSQLKLSYTSFGFGILIFGHVMINAGMNMGLLPTKGLTMPFYSYGGSAMLFSIIMIAIILKIDSQSLDIVKKGESRSY